MTEVTEITENQKVLFYRQALEGITLMNRPRPKKTELARIKAMSDLGLTPHAIGQRLGRDGKTIRRYLDSDVYHDPELQEMVAIIKKRELEDLYLLGAKGRKRLHELLDQGDTKVIETIALVDRTFTQRQLLEGKPTENINVHNVAQQLQEALDQTLEFRSYVLAEIERRKEQGKTDEH